MRNTPEFDSYAETYDAAMDTAISVTGQSRHVFLQVKADLLIACAERWTGRPSHQLEFLDVGCGSGTLYRLLQSGVKAIVGVDVSPRQIETARILTPQGTFLTCEPQRLPFEDASFDITFAVCVLHHVPPEYWTAFLQEMFRVTRPDGRVILLEHNPLNPFTRMVVSRCSFDKDAVLLTQTTAARLIRSSHAKRLARGYFLCLPFQGRLFRWLDHVLRQFPFGAQYWIVAEKSEPSSPENLSVNEDALPGTHGETSPSPAQTHG